VVEALVVILAVVVVTVVALRFMLSVGRLW
jgi:hypothetical protein